MRLTWHEHSAPGWTVFSFRAIGVMTKKIFVEDIVVIQERLTGIAFWSWINGRTVKKKISVKKLLSWRLEKAKAEAPPAPSAARLLALARPWWETSPERFQLAVRRLNSIQIAHALPIPKSRSPIQGPVPTLIVRAGEELATSVRIKSMDFSHQRLQLSFQCHIGAEPDQQEVEVTIVSELTSKPLFCALAAKSLSGEYSFEAELSPEVAEHWKRLKVIDRAAFWLILRPVASAI
jgi:hypothetical protein